MINAILAICAAANLAAAQAAPPPTEVTDTIDYCLLDIGIAYVTVTPDPETWYLTLVSSNYRIAPDSAPPKLASVKGKFPRKMDERVTPHFDAMYDAARADGVTLIPSSGYRTIEHQKKAYNTLARRLALRDTLPPERAALKASNGTAFPGASEHNLGISVDILTAGEEKVGLHFVGTDQYEWLMAHAADYGFVLRFPPGKKALTGVNYEPWHWRYVGVEVARELKATGKCLEEYLGIYYLDPEAAQELQDKGVDVEEYLRNQGK